jgi:pre-60S factor REI1
MKRRIASLPPVTLETFNEKVLAAKATSNEAAAKASYEKTCHTCNKAFYSENSYQNHINSSKHKQRAASLRKDGDAASVQSSAFSLGEPVTKSDNDVNKVTEDLKAATIDEEEDEDMETDIKKDEFSPSRCLFCKTDSTDIHTNVDHMRKDHGMFIPEQKYLADLDGLVNYLYRKITENFECLYCHAIKNDAQAIQTHMRDKSHCMIAFESEEEQVEIGQYYDFRSTYSDDEDESTAESGGVRVNGDEDQGWETDSSASSVDEDDLDSYRNASGAYEADYELHLPSGKSVGHRSLAKYYKQNLHKYPSAAERAARQLAIANGEIEEEPPRVRNNHHRALVTRANGGMGMIGVTEEQKEAALIADRRERTRALRQENRYVARVQRANNHQKHYRVCSTRAVLLFCKTNFLTRIPFCNDRFIPTSTGNHINRPVFIYGNVFWTSPTKHIRQYSQYITNHRSSSTCTLVTPVPPVPEDCSTFGNLWVSTSLSNQRNNQVRYSFRTGPFSQMSFSTRSVLTRPHRTLDNFMMDVWIGITCCIYLLLSLCRHLLLSGGFFCKEHSCI